MTNIVFIVLLSILVFIGVILPICREYKKEKEYIFLLKAIEDKTRFYYKKDTSGIYCIIKHINNTKTDMYLNVEVIYPDDSRETFYTSYDVFKNTWELDTKQIKQPF